MIDEKKLGNLIVKKASGNSKKATQLYQMFFFERILERISKSRYSNQIILKGGMLLTSVIGDDYRVTRDMDTTVTGFPLERELVLKIIGEILSIDINDTVSFEILGINEMRVGNAKGGFQIKIKAKMNTIYNTLSLELTTGDPITPREMEYPYNCIFEDKKIPILAYTLETVIAEKFHAIMSRGEENTRMKDFYDLYTLIDRTDTKKEINNIAKAIINTFRSREIQINISEMREKLKIIRESKKLSVFWNQYQKETFFATGIEYIDLFKAISIIIDQLEDELVK